MTFTLLTPPVLRGESFKQKIGGVLYLRNWPAPLPVGAVQHLGISRGEVPDTDISLPGLTHNSYKCTSSLIGWNGCHVISTRLRGNDIAELSLL